MSRSRLDVALVARGMFASRSAAQAAIAAGLVRVDGQVITRHAAPVAADARIEATPAHPYVSRGGVKLAFALDHFGIDPAGCLCLDVGASTGGFTDVLLRRGAARIVAVDVGSAQLHPSLRAEPRVTSLEKTDIRTLSAEALPAPAALIVVDVSFVPLRLVLPALGPLAADGAALVLLVKPQFEVGPARVGRGGIVRDEAARLAALDDIRSDAGRLGWQVLGTVQSPIAGGDGNIEYLVAARRA